jgi:hypothetical protein
LGAGGRVITVAPAAFDITIKILCHPYLVADGHFPAIQTAIGCSRRIVVPTTAVGAGSYCLNPDDPD